MCETWKSMLAEKTTSSTERHSASAVKFVDSKTRMTSLENQLVVLILHIFLPYRWEICSLRKRKKGRKVWKNPKKENKTKQKNPPKTTISTYQTKQTKSPQTTHNQTHSEPNLTFGSTLFSSVDQCSFSALAFYSHIKEVLLWCNAKSLSSNSEKAG